MIKTATLYRIISEPADTLDARASFDAAAFTPCGSTQQISSGWVPPRGIEHGALLEIVSGQWILKLATETKKVPSPVLDNEVSRIAKEAEALTGRKPGKKQRREIREEALLSLLPAAFPSRLDTLVWIDVANKLVLIDTASTGRADAVVTELIRCQEGLGLALIQPNETPALAMAKWLRDREPIEFLEIGRACELKATDDSKANVKYTHHDLFIPEIQQHIASGMLPISLAMCWDDRVSFSLTDKLTLKGITMLEDTRVPPAEAVDAFDADVVLFTGEMRTLVIDLLIALGGEAQAPKEQANG